MEPISPHKADIDALGENEILIVLDFFYQGYLNANTKIIYDFKTKKINNLQFTKGNLIKLLSSEKTLLFLPKQELDYLLKIYYESN